VFTSTTVALHTSVDAVGTSVTVTDHAENRPSVTLATDVVVAAVYVNVSKLDADPTGPTEPADPLDIVGTKNELSA